MIAIKRLHNYLDKQLFGIKETAPEKAYDLWAASYDDQPDNLMLALDESIFSILLNQIQLKDKIVIDVGCGTGRHWKKIITKQPKKITGFDVSEKMLSVLQQKFPQAETYHLTNNKLNDVKNNSFDIIISTLTIAHIEKAEEALTAWNRILKPGGDIIITDYHPAALAKGGDRTFKYNDKLVAIINHVHPVNKILNIAGQLNLKVLQLIEKNIDDSVRPYYEKHNALTIFEKWKNTPIIYGLRLKKQMLLYNVNIVDEKGIQNIRIENGMIEAVTSNKDLLKTFSGDIKIEFENCITFPGLINSHDHLDFNLFPQLGNRIYKNYVEWGNDIHQKNKTAINAILKIPKTLRIQWGVYKNLLNGITTVVNHGKKLDVPNNIINVFQNCHSLHSVKLEKRWKCQLNNPFINNFPFVIHVGEGTDNDSCNEIDEVIKWNMLKRKIIGIHGVSMNEKQASSFHALVWCPDSNFFLLGATAAIDKLKITTNILFGTDSTVSANWNTWQQLRVARQTGLLTDEELIDSVTTLPAAIWKLNNTGALKEAHYADIVIARKKNNTANNTDAFFALNPEDILLILNKGAIIFFDESLSSQLKNILIENYSKIFIKNICKYVIGNLTLLIKEIKKYNPDSFFPIETDN